MRGSPPQVRGKPNKRHYLEQLCRITPAGAGKTPVSGTSRVEPEDHPRRCGENIPETHRRMLRPGSPPQVRGKRRPEQGFTDLVGITPAGAGKTPVD